MLFLSRCQTRNLAHNLNEPDIKKVVKSGGQSLAFIVYPEAISKIEFIPQVRR